MRLFSGKDAETDGPLTGLRQSLFSADARHILELGRLCHVRTDPMALFFLHDRLMYSSLVGAGTGIVAITLAILRSALDLSDQPGSIVTTDLRTCPLPTQPHNPTPLIRTDSLCDTHPTRERHLQSPPNEQMHS